MGYCLLTKNIFIKEIGLISRVSISKRCPNIFESFSFQLEHALSVFGIHARGPQMDNYIQKLMKECDKYWKNGRQMCEVLSLTGNLCNLLQHKAPTGEAVSSESTEKYVIGAFNLFAVRGSS